ncbi:hypothetical protein KM043_014488 [Ampulex compressa]|nr:hypothetical protein KM043_014488 [Ampulex compressa]
MGTSTTCGEVLYDELECSRRPSPALSSTIKDRRRAFASRAPYVCLRFDQSVLQGSRGTRPSANCSPNALRNPAAGSPVTLCLRGFDSRMGMRQVPRSGGRVTAAATAALDAVPRCIHRQEGTLFAPFHSSLVFPSPGAPCNAGNTLWDIVFCNR